MNFKCDKCGKPATVHLTEIVNGEKIEKHLCEQCAGTEGVTIKANVPISQLLEDFILQSSPQDEYSELHCDVCGMTFAQFREEGLLGCPHDYEVFEKGLETLLKRAQQGAIQHVGKVPKHAGDDKKKHVAMLRLRGQLKDAVADEDYEAAAKIRDQIRDLETA